MISETYLVRLRREMKRLQKRCPVATVVELTPARLIAYCEFGRASRKTYNNRRGTGFLKFALQREWIAENPLAKIPVFRNRRKRGGAQTLTAAKAKELMEFAALFLCRPSTSRAELAPSWRLNLRLNIGLEPESVLGRVIERHIGRCELVAAETARQGVALDVTFHLELRPATRPDALVQDLQLHRRCAKHQPATS